MRISDSNKRITKRIDDIQNGINVSQQGYTVAIIESDCCDDDHYKPVLPEGLVVYSGCIPAIHVPNNRVVHYCHFRADEFIRFLEHPESENMYLAESWEELFDTGYNNNKYVFEAEGKRPNVFGESVKYRCRLSELRPGDIVETIYPPSVMQGDEVPRIEPDEDTLDQYVPKNYVSRDIDDIDVSDKCIHYYFVGGCTVDQTENIATDIDDSARWWPCYAFPNSRNVLNSYHAFLSHSITGAPGLGAPPDVTSVITYTIDRPIRDIKDANGTYLDVENYIRRLKSILNIKYGIRMNIYASVSYYGISTSKGFITNTKIKEDNYYKIRIPVSNIRVSHYPDNILGDAGSILNGEGVNLNLHKCLVRSLRYLDMARTTSISEVSMMLFWAAIESLLSPNDKMELISNISICLQGLNGNREKRLEIWDKSKTSYGIRSNIVHSAHEYADDQIEESLAYVEEQCVNILRYVLEHENKNQLTRQDLIQELKSKAFSM